MAVPQPSKSESRLIGLLFLLLGGGAIIGGIWTLFQSIRCEYWPVTEGMIETSEMQSDRGVHRHGNVTHVNRSYSANISYDYEVTGRHYTGTRLAFGEMSGSSAYAQEILNRFPIEQKVSIHYSPGDPEQSVLETGIHGGTWICLGVGSLFFLMGAAFYKTPQPPPFAPNK